MKKYLVCLGLALALAGVFAPVAASQPLNYCFPFWKILVFGIEPGRPYIINDIQFDPNPIQGYAPISGTAFVITPTGAELVPFISDWSGHGMLSLYLMKKLDSEDNARAFPLLYPSLSDLYPNLYPDYEKQRLGDIEKEEANTLAAMKVAAMLNIAAILNESTKNSMRGIARPPDRVLFSIAVFYFESGSYGEAKELFLGLCDSVTANAKTKEEARAYLKRISEKGGK